MTHVVNAPHGPLERLGPSVVEQVRVIREQMEEESGHELHRIAEHARRVAEEFRARHRAAGTVDCK